eukprot:8499624-Ditylum_brightwellii.AAC.1
MPRLPNRFSDGSRLIVLATVLMGGTNALAFVIAQAMHRKDSAWPNMIFRSVLDLISSILCIINMTLRDI